RGGPGGVGPLRRLWVPRPGEFGASGARLQIRRFGPRAVPLRPAQRGGGHPAGRVLNRAGLWALVAALSAGLAAPAAAQQAEDAPRLDHRGALGFILGSGVAVQETVL